MKTESAAASTKVSLYDQNTVVMADGPKSVAYFCKKMPLTVNWKILEELKEVAKTLGGRDLRLCLQPGPEALFHEMIILGRGNKYYRPHKHLTKEESLHILEGKMGIICFTDDGKVLDSGLIKPGEDFIYKISSNTYHTVIPLTEIVLYKESKLGPFIANANDSIYPTWAPEERSPKVNECLKSFMKVFSDRS